MSKKDSFGCIVGILSLCISTPIWYYLMYKILVMVQATDIMWFLFWVYVPVGLLVQILVKVSESIFKDDKA